MIQRSIRVLSVHGDPCLRIAIEGQLRSVAGQPCEHAFESSEDAAIESFCLDRTDAVLVEYPLSSGDGLRLIERLRAFDPLVPILALSAGNLGVETDGLLRAGADDCLDRRRLEGEHLEMCLGSALRRSEAFRGRVPAVGHLETEVLDRVRDLYRFLEKLGPDELAVRSGAVLAAARRAGGLDVVTTAFDYVCHESGDRPDSARRILEPYLLSVLTRLSTAHDTTR